MTLADISRRRIIGGTLATATLGSIGKVKAQQSEPIKIGVCLSLSGPVSDIGQASLRGARIATNEINQSGGVDGKLVELEVHDTKLSPPELIGAMRELSGNGVNMFIGDGFSTMTIAALPLVQGLDVVFMAPANTLMDATHNLFTRNYFRCGSNAHMQTGAQAYVMATVAPDAVRWGAIVTDNLGQRTFWDSLSKGLQHFYPKIAGRQIEIVEAVPVKQGTPDFRNAIAQLLSLKLDGIHVSVVGNEAVTFYQQARPFGLFQNVKAVADTILAVDAGPALKSSVPPNFWSYCLWYYDGYKQVPMAQRFYKADTEETKRSDVNPFSAHAHTAIMSFAAGVRAAKSTKTEAIIGALETITFDSIFGPLRYRQEDHQLLINPAYLHVEPLGTEPGYRIAGFKTVPWQDVIEPATPGVAFKEG